MKKIEWFQEVLALEPSSKLFFPLAKLFVETGEVDQAVDTLRKGIDRHPDFMEARLLLVELLSRQGRVDQAYEIASPLTETLSGYPSFWKGWSKKELDTDADFGAALAFAAARMSGESLSWSTIIEKGLKAIIQEASSAGLREGFGQDPEYLDGDEIDSLVDAVDDVREDEDAEAPAREGGFRTKTMADLLASQGDKEGAAAIYRELLDSYGPGPKRDELEACLAGLGEGSRGVDVVADGGADPYESHPKKRLVSTLEKLAQRLEARAGA